MAHGPREETLKSSELAKAVIDAILERKGFDIVLLDMRAVSYIADYFVICRGRVDRQVEAIVEELGMQLKQHNVQPWHIEGVATSGWMLIDYGSVVVHIFTPAERAYYELEHLWRDAQVVLRIQ